VPQITENNFQDFKKKEKDKEGEVTW